jgi:hypothetical protein
MQDVREYTRERAGAVKAAVGRALCRRGGGYITRRHPGPFAPLDPRTMSLLSPAVAVWARVGGGVKRASVGLRVRSLYPRLRPEPMRWRLTRGEPFYASAQLTKRRRAALEPADDRRPMRTQGRERTMVNRAAIVVPSLCLLVLGLYALSLTTRPAQPPSVEPDPGQDSHATLSLGNPLQVGTIAIVPIVTRTPISREKYITLSDATKQGLIEIVEIPGQEQVNALEVRNRAKLPLMLFAGELLLGGKQDRIIGNDTIVAPHASRRVEVYCVEHGRWDGEYKQFSSGEMLVPGEVRQAALETKSQTEVWDQVAKRSVTARIASPTAALRAVVSDPDIRSKVDALTDKLRTAFAPYPQAVGMICWLDGRIYNADVFANTGLFAAGRDKVLRSYASDAVLDEDARSDAVDMRACRTFLAEIQASERTLAGRTSDETTMKIKSSRISGYESGSVLFGATPMGYTPYGQAPRPGENRPPMTMRGYSHGTYRPADGPGARSRAYDRTPYGQSARPGEFRQPVRTGDPSHRTFRPSNTPTPR